MLAGAYLALPAGCFTTLTRSILPIPTIFAGGYCTRSTSEHKSRSHHTAPASVPLRYSSHQVNHAIRMRMLVQAPVAARVPSLSCEHQRLHPPCQGLSASRLCHSSHVREKGGAGALPLARRILRGRSLPPAAEVEDNSNLQQCACSVQGTARILP